MKYRHYAPKAPVYLLEGEVLGEPQIAENILAHGMKVGVLCSNSTAERLPKNSALQLSCWGNSLEQLAGDLFCLPLRDFLIEQSLM